MHSTASKPLVPVVLLYMAASLVHFIHNAEYLTDYPGLPETWTRIGVYAAWLGMTAIGAVGLLLVAKGFGRAGLALVAVHSILGVDSLGHYVVAPMSAHTVAMNFTIMLEVVAATLVLITVIRQVLFVVRQGRTSS